MTNQEAIELIKVAQAEVEWSCPMDYAAAFDLAIKALEQQPCEDAISRQAAIEAMGEQPLNWTDTPEEIAEEMMWEDHVKALKELPSAEPKTGRWMDRFPAKECKCSVCDFLICISNGSYIDMVGQMKYCPNCGAKMESEGEE